MSDWRNTIPMIVNKVRLQLYATNYDDLEKISAHFKVETVEQGTGHNQQRFS